MKYEVRMRITGREKIGGRGIPSSFVFYSKLAGLHDYMMPVDLFYPRIVGKGVISAQRTIGLEWKPGDQHEIRASSSPVVTITRPPASDGKEPSRTNVGEFIHSAS